MSKFFDVEGPFEIGRSDGSIYRARQSVWDDMSDGLCSAIGCYMFAIRHGDKITPWYVGMTVCAAGFYGEVFTDHKIELYNSVSGIRGSRQLFLFPLMTGDRNNVGRYSRNRSAGRRTILWLEKTLMGLALAQNEQLLNTRDLTLPKSITVRGLLGERSRGRPYTEVVEARQALFGSNNR